MGKVKIYLSKDYNKTSFFHYRTNKLSLYFNFQYGE